MKASVSVEKLKRNKALARAAIPAGIIALGMKAVTISHIYDIPYLNLVELTPAILTIFPADLVRQVSSYLSYFIPIFAILYFPSRLFAGGTGEEIKRGSTRISPRELRKVILKDIKKKRRK